MPATSFSANINSIGTNEIGESWETAGDWSNNRSASVGNDYFIKGGHTIRTPNTTGSFSFPGDSLTIESGGVLALKNQSPITANIIGAGGSISHFGIGNSPDDAVIRGTVSLSSGGLIFSAGTTDRLITLESNISGTGDITKNGDGILVLSSDANTFNGRTVIAGGTIRLTGGANRLPTSTTLAFTGSGTLNLTNTSQTISQLTVPTMTDVNLTVRGSGGGGSLTINGAYDFHIGPGSESDTERVSNGIATDINFSLLSVLTYNSSGKDFRVGLRPGSFNSGELGNVATATLAASNNITAATLAVGDDDGTSSGGNSIVKLGTTNSINVNTINIGASGRSNSSFAFAPGLTNPVATIRNTSGGDSAVSDWFVGEASSFHTEGYNTWTDTVDFTAGELDAKVTNLFVGDSLIGPSQINRGGTENATFSMGKGTLEATTISLGRIEGGGVSSVGVTATLAANGTFNLGHADGIVKAATLRFSQNTILSNTGTKEVNGTFNLLNGTLEVGSIELGDQTGTATATATFNWTTGTIRNTAGADLMIDAVPITLVSGTHTFEATGTNTITVKGTANISGTGGLVKTGSGTLRLNGTKDYVGGTSVIEGSLILDQLASPGAGSVTVSAGATLGGGGTINGRATIQGIHAPGFSPGVQTFANGLAYGASAILQWEFVGNTLAVAGTDYDLVNVTGGDLTVSPGAILALLASGIDYSQSEWASARDFTVIDFSGASSTGNFLLDTTGAGSFASHGSWSSQNSGGDIVLSWTPVPEPSTAILVTTMAFLRLIIRRR